jgi:hypothetical protein
MRVITSVLTAALVALAFGTLAAAPAPSADQKPVAPAVSENVAAADTMPGCPGKANGAPCCAGCQEQHAKLAAAADAGQAAPSGGCPCQERARRLREAAQRARQEQ